MKCSFVGEEFNNIRKNLDNFTCLIFNKNENELSVYDIKNIINFNSKSTVDTISNMELVFECSFVYTNGDNTMFKSCDKSIMSFYKDNRCILTTDLKEDFPEIYNLIIEDLKDLYKEVKL